MPRLFYFTIAIIEFVSYLLIDPFHMMKGWSVNEGKESGRMMTIRRTGIAIMIIALVIAVAPSIFHCIIS